MSARPEAPGPNRRRGPRPLLFHLAQAMLTGVPDGATPGVTGRQGGAGPQRHAAQEGMPETGLPETGMPKMGMPKTVTPETSSSKTDLPVSGLPKTGTPQTGMPQTGMPQTGSPQMGLPEMDPPRTERRRAGEPGTGQAETDGSSAWPPGWTGWSASWPGSAPWGQPAAAGSDPPPPIPDAALLAGIAAYRRHPYERRVAEPPCIWTEGGSRLLDYGPAGAPPVLVVPSLVNRAYVLDLAEQHSMLRFLAAGGVRPLLLDWGWPDAAARSFTLTDYVAGRLERALVSVGRPVTLAGYCMGGLMAVAEAARRPDLVSRLVLLATPWDFWAADTPAEDVPAGHPWAENTLAEKTWAEDIRAEDTRAEDVPAGDVRAKHGAAARRLGACLPLLEPALALGTLPVDALQVLFSLAEPGSVAAKYRAFGTQDQQGRRAEMFVAIEDWLSDGVPLAAPVAREVLAGWYGGNTPARGLWRCAGLAVRPPAMPSFIAVPGRDRIVPPGSALALAAAMPDAVVVRPQAGHVGMVAGSGARAALWEPLLAWLRG